MSPVGGPSGRHEVEIASAADMKAERKSAADFAKKQKKLKALNKKSMTATAAPTSSTSTAKSKPAAGANAALPEPKRVNFLRRWLGRS